MVLNTPLEKLGTIKCLNQPKIENGFTKMKWIKYMKLWYLIKENSVTQFKNNGKSTAGFNGVTNIHKSVTNYCAHSINIPLFEAMKETKAHFKPMSPFYTPRKHQKTRGCRERTLAWNRLIVIFHESFNLIPLLSMVSMS